MNYVERIVARQQKEYRKETYINFKDAVILKLKKKELEERLQWLEENNYSFIKHTTMRMNFPPLSYSLTYNDHLIKLAYFDGNKYYWCTTNYHDDQKNISTPNSFKVFKSMFKKRTGIKMLDAYGKVEHGFKVFCPKPLYYISSLWDKCIWLSGISKEDYCSHYPASALEILPDASTRVDRNEYVKPNSEYEFAFYPDTGHIAIFNEFDSHDFNKYIKTYTAKVAVGKFAPDYYGSDSRTILMKRSQYSLSDEIMFFYNQKCNSPKNSLEYYESKIFLLKFIGMLEQCSSKMYSSYPYAHLASVIKWRSNVKMFKTLQQIGFRNIIQVCVDGVIHAGDPVGKVSNKIGDLNIEVTDALFVQRGINQYILKGDHYKEVKHTGLDVNIDSNNVMTWFASEKIDFLSYIKRKYVIEELL